MTAATRPAAPSRALIQHGWGQPCSHNDMAGATMQYGLVLAVQESLMRFLRPLRRARLPLPASADVGRGLAAQEPPPARLSDQLVVVVAQLAQRGCSVLAPDHVQPRHLGLRPAG